MSLRLWQAKVALIFGLALLALGVLAGCVAIPPPAPLPVPTVVNLTGEPPPAMTEAEARAIAATSDCAQVGALKETAFYNDSTGTWWIDLAADKPGCSPACVVNASTQAAEVNWRCTGLLPPETPAPTGQSGEPAATASALPLPAMMEAEARAIAAKSDCVQAGALKETAFYNDSTGTWWIDLAVDKPGCSPACVVNISSQEAEVNWRCTGLLPPETPAPSPAPALPETPVATPISASPAGPQNLAALATATASSVLAEDGYGDYVAALAVDGSLSTPWCEAVAGAGTGEWLQLTFPAPVEIAELGLSVGYDREADDAGQRTELFTENNRVKQATLAFSDGRQAMASFADVAGIQKISLADAPGGPIITTSVMVTIDEVFPGTRWNDTCIAEIQVWGQMK